MSSISFFFLKKTHITKHEFKQYLFKKHISSIIYFPAKQNNTPNSRLLKFNKPLSDKTVQSRKDKSEDGVVVCLNESFLVTQIV
jgi:hypothetical protein